MKYVLEKKNYFMILILTRTLSHSKIFCYMIPNLLIEITDTIKQNINKQIKILSVIVKTAYYLPGKVTFIILTMKYFNQYFLILIFVCESLFCEESEHPEQTACLQLSAIPKKPFVSTYVTSYYNA